MITKMKKVDLLVFHQEYDEFLNQLRDLGVVHIQEKESGTSEEFEQAKAQSELYSQFLKTLDRLPVGEEKSSKTLSLDSAESVISFTEEQISLKGELARQLDATVKDLEVSEPFGDFDADKVSQLEAAGYQMNFYSCSAAAFKEEWANEYYATPVAQNGSTTYFVTFSPEKPAIDAEIITLPAKTISELKEQQAAIETQIADVDETLQAVNEQCRSIIETAVVENKNAIQLSKVHLNSQNVAGNALKLIEGWIPEDKESAVKEMLTSSSAYFEIREPQKGDRVPIKFSNGGFSKMYERLTKMYGFPCYDEWDPTPIVGIFFTLFFAICMGDAGYGVLIMLYGILDMTGKAKSVPILGEMLEGCGSMITSLGVATTIIGLCLGTVFGLNIVDAGWLNPNAGFGAMVNWLSHGEIAGYSVQMVAAICIGVFHICLALVIKAALYTKKEGFKSQISTWGWVLLLVGGVITGVLFLAGALSQDAMTMVLIGIGAVSALAIYFLNNIGRLAKNPIVGILVNPLAGLYDTYNMASGLMGDILSYIRLYALCLAGGMLGGAFNMIGDMIRGDEGSIVLLIPAILIYVLGHLFNLLMSAISAFVHPLRLNFVEYFKNAGYEGKGHAYNPFEEKK